MRRGGGVVRLFSVSMARFFNAPILPKTPMMDKTGRRERHHTCELVTICDKFRHFFVQKHEALPMASAIKVPDCFILRRSAGSAAKKCEAADEG